MARLKTVGLEQQHLAADSELFYVFGAPNIVTNIDPLTGDATVWDDLNEEWDSLDVPWPGGAGGSAVYEPEGVRSGYYAINTAVGDFFDIKASSKGGGGYNRAYMKIKQLPDTPTAVMYFIRQSDDLNIATMELQPDGRLRFYYRNDAGVKAYVGDYSPYLGTDYHCLEFAIIGLETGTNREFEARLDHLRFAHGTVTDQSAYDGYLGMGPNYDADDVATAGSFYWDDIATNDGNVYDWDRDNNTWCGPGKVVLLPVVGDDELVGNTGWTRGGIDTGSDWGQVAQVSPPADGDSYLIGGNDDYIADFRVGSPRDAGIGDADRINAVVANARWSMADETEGASLSVYLRAGSNLDQDGSIIDLFGEAWFTGDAAGRAPDVYSTDRLPATDMRWTTNDVAQARIGMQIIDITPDIYVGGLWVLVDYTPYEEEDYTITIDGIDRVAEVRKQSPNISDRINEVANTANFDVYDLHGFGKPNTGDEVIITSRGIRLFAGTVARNSVIALGNSEQYYRVKCIDYTRSLDRRLVSATYKNMTDRAIIQAIVDEYCGGEDISTYFVTETIMVSQVSFNYVSVSKAIQQIADLTGCNWFIDYYKNLRYFPRTQQQAPFEIDSDGSKHENLQIDFDETRLRNRVYVRGGTTLTTSPITENIVADGEQRVFLLAEKPHDVSVTINGTPATLGIKNIDDAASYDFLLSFQEKYIEAGTALTTPIAGAIIAVTYNYDVPILVAVEDSDSIEENGVYEFPIIDKQITTSEQAINRAIAELTDYADDIVEGSYETREVGVRTGQYQRVRYGSRGVDDDYVVDSVTYKAIGGGLFNITITLTSAKTLGIIRFLLNILQMNRTVGEFDEDEQVDQLLTLVDTLDSLMDSMTSDSTGYTFKWSNDAGTTPNKLKWDLGSWS